MAFNISAFAGGLGKGATDALIRHEDLEAKIKIASAKKSDSLLPLKKDIAKLGGVPKPDASESQLITQLSELTNIKTERNVAQSMLELERAAFENNGQLFFNYQTKRKKIPDYVIFPSNKTVRQNNRQVFGESTGTTQPTSTQNIRLMQARLMELDNVFRNKKTIIDNNPNLISNFLDRNVLPLLTLIDDDDVQKETIFGVLKGAMPNIIKDKDISTEIFSKLGHKLDKIANNPSGEFLTNAKNESIIEGGISHTEAPNLVKVDSNYESGKGKIIFRNPKIQKKENSNINIVLTSKDIVTLSSKGQRLLAARDKVNSNQNYVKDEIIQSTLGKKPLIKYGYKNIGDSVEAFVIGDGNEEVIRDLSKKLSFARDNKLEDEINIYRIIERLYARVSPHKDTVVFEKGLVPGGPKLTTRSQVEVNVDDAAKDKKIISTLDANSNTIANMSKMVSGIEDALLLSGIAKIATTQQNGEITLTEEMMDAFLKIAQYTPSDQISETQDGRKEVTPTGVQVAFIRALRGNDLNENIKSQLKMKGSTAAAGGAIAVTRFFNNFFANVTGIIQASEALYDKNKDLYQLDQGVLGGVFSKGTQTVNMANSFDGGVYNKNNTVSGKEVRELYQAEINKLNESRNAYRNQDVSTAAGRRAYLQAYAQAQLSYYKINLAYQYAAYIQGGAAARTVSDADFLNNFRALFQQEGAGLVAVVDEVRDQIRQDEKLTRAMLNHHPDNRGLMHKIIAPLRSFGSLRLSDQRRARHEKYLSGRITTPSGRIVSPIQTSPKQSGANIEYKSTDQKAYKLVEAAYENPVSKKTTDGRNVSFRLMKRYPSKSDPTLFPQEAKRFDRAVASQFEQSAKELYETIKRETGTVFPFTPDNINANINTIDRLIYRGEEGDKQATAGNKGIGRRFEKLAEFHGIKDSKGIVPGLKTGTNLKAILQRFRDERIFAKIARFNSDPEPFSKDKMKRFKLTALDFDHEVQIEMLRNLVLNHAENIYGKN